jgi:hypothetical protein
MRLLPVLATALLASAPLLHAEEDTALLPQVTLHLEAARYAPVETDLREVGWIGAGAELFRVSKTQFWFVADLETTVGNTYRAFDATQANYHLELSVRRPVGRYLAEAVFHHVSRHEQDRPKDHGVDWNTAAARVEGPLAGGRFTASLGGMTEAAAVRYRFEAQGAYERDAVKLGRNALYGLGAVRYVTAHASEAFPRTRFADLRAEGGVRFPREAASLQLYGAWERRHDVFVQQAGVRDRALFGFRIWRGPGVAVPPQP